MTTDPNQSWMADPLVWMFGLLANGIAFAQSVSVGAVAAFCTVAIPLIATAIKVLITTLGPPWIQFYKDWQAAKATTFAGQMEALTRALEDAKRQAAVALADARAQAQTTRDLAAETAQLAKARGERAEELAGSVRTLSDQLARLSAQVSDQTAKLSEQTAQIETGNARVNDANQKLHAMTRLLTAAESRAKNAELDLHEMLDQVRHNGSLTEEARAEILRFAGAATDAARVVDAKADHVVEAVDSLRQAAAPPAPPA